MLSLYSILPVLLLFFFTLSFRQLYHGVLEKVDRDCHAVACGNYSITGPSTTLEEVFPGTTQRG